MTKDRENKPQHLNLNRRADERRQQLEEYKSAKAAKK